MEYRDRRRGAPVLEVVSGDQRFQLEYPTIGWKFALRLVVQRLQHDCRVSTDARNALDEAISPQHGVMPALAE